MADKTTNSLVVTASKQDYETVRAILNKLDVPRDQVYVEGIFADIQVSNSHKWELIIITWLEVRSAGRSGFVSSSDDVGNILNPANDAGAILGFGGGGTVQITPPGASAPITIPSLVGFLNFLATLTSVNVLSTPQIMALDNEEAEIEVGENDPISTTTTPNATGTRLQFRFNVKTSRLN